MSDLSGLTPQFSGQSGTPDFSGNFWRGWFKSASILFDRALNLLDGNIRPASLYGLSKDELVPVYKEAKGSSLRHTRLWDVRHDLKKFSLNEIAAIMQVESGRGNLWTGAHIAAERAQINAYHGSPVFDRSKRAANVRRNIETLQKLGYTAAQVRDIYSHKKIWQTFTAHPTKDKSPDGSALHRDHTAIAEGVAPADREQAISGLSQQLLTTRTTSLKKDSYSDETVDGINAQRVYNEGMLDYFEDVQHALDDIYGENVVSLIDKNMHLDVAPRKWHGGDADGKHVGATVLFNQRVLDSLTAVEINLTNLRNPELTGRTGAKDLEPMIAAFESFKQGLQSLHSRAGEIEKMKSGSAEFEAVQAQFSQAFRSTAYKGQTFERGPELTAAIMDDLRRIEADVNVDPAVRSAAWRTVFLHKQNGIAMGRTELRHNGEDYDVIFKNLYKYLREQKLGNGIDGNTQTGKALRSIKQLDAKNPDTQAVFYKHLMEEYGDQVGQWLQEANPPSDNPKENWSNEILQRFMMVRRCFNNNRMGAFIIAEAKPISAVQQQVMAEALGMKNLVHVSLNEDQEMIKDAPRNLKLYNPVFGKNNLKLRESEGGAYYVVMDPQSDSQRGYGMFIRGLQRITDQGLIKTALELGVAVFKKIGTGASYARGGFSPKIVPRLFINALTGVEGWQDGDKGILRQMASFVSTTTQGRDIALRFGTGEQVYDMLDGVDSEINAACAVVDEKIKPEVAFSCDVKYSTQMRYVLEELRQAQCDLYHDVLRNEESKKILGAKRMDLYHEETSALLVSEMSNTGAREDTRAGATGTPRARTPKHVVGDGSDEDKGLRAIGTNIATENGETYFDGYYSMGFFLQGLHKAYKEGRIDRKDLQDLLSDDFYMRQKFPNAFAALASADFEHGYDQMTHGHGKWNVGMVRDRSNTNYKGMGENMAYHTVLANNAIMATAYMDALLNVGDGAFDRDEDYIVAKLYNREDGLSQLKFGSATKAMYPDIEQLQDYAGEKRLARAAVHEIERRCRLFATDPGDPQAIDLNDKKNADLVRHIATARRNMGPINMNNLLDQPGSAFAARPKPVLEVVRDYMKKALGISVSAAPGASPSEI